MEVTVSYCFFTFYGHQSEVVIINKEGMDPQKSIHMNLIVMVFMKYKKLIQHVHFVISYQELVYILLEFG